MASLRFTQVPQPVIPNQRNDEVIYVLSRKHFLDYMPFVLIIAALIIIFLGSVLVGLQPLVVFLQNGGTLVRDIAILIFVAYYLVISGIFIASWVGFYFYLFVVTDERVVEIHQKGLFNREFDELDFQQIEDISSVTKGALNTFFNVGDIIIQTAGTATYFRIDRIWRPQLAVEIIHSLTHQAKDGVLPVSRFPDLETIGLINGRYITRSNRCLPIMNMEKDLKAKTDIYKKTIQKATTLREKIDRWWWRHNDQMVATFGPTVADDEEDYPRDYAPTINQDEQEDAPVDISQKAKEENKEESLTPIEEEKEESKRF